MQLDEAIQRITDFAGSDQVTVHRVAGQVRTMRVRTAGSRRLAAVISGSTDDMFRTLSAAIAAGGASSAGLSAMGAVITLHAEHLLALATQLPAYSS